MTRAVPPPLPSPAGWPELHRYALAYQGDASAATAWLAAYADRITCKKCRRNWSAWVAANPPDLRDAERFFAWTYAAHDAVNVLLGLESPPLLAVRANYL